MELWIRSQDRTTLLKVDRLDIDYSSGLYLIKSDGFSTLLANYKSEERALEVLDEIQKILQPKGIIKYGGILDAESQKKVSEMLDNKYLIFNNNVELLKQVDTYVYEMPKE